MIFHSYVAVDRRVEDGFSTTHHWNGTNDFWKLNIVYLCTSTWLQIEVGKTLKVSGWYIPAKNLSVLGSGAPKPSTSIQRARPQAICKHCTPIMSSRVPTGCTTLVIVNSLSLKLCPKQTAHKIRKLYCFPSTLLHGGYHSLLNCIWCICPIVQRSQLAPCQLLDHSFYCAYDDSWLFNNLVG